MKTTGVRQGKCIMHSDVMNTAFNSGDVIKLSAEVSAVLLSERTSNRTNVPTSN